MGKGRERGGKKRKREKREETGKVLPTPSEEQLGEIRSGRSLSLKGTFAPECDLAVTGPWAGQGTA